MTKRIRMVPLRKHIEMSPKATHTLVELIDRSEDVIPTSIDFNTLSVTPSLRALAKQSIFLFGCTKEKDGLPRKARNDDGIEVRESLSRRSSIIDKSFLLLFFKKRSPYLRLRWSSV